MRSNGFALSCTNGSEHGAHRPSKIVVLIGKMRINDWTQGMFLCFSTTSKDKHQGSLFFGGENHA